MKVYVLFYSSNSYESIEGVYKKEEDARRVKKQYDMPWEYTIYEMELL